MSASGGWIVSARAGRDFKRLDPPVQRRIVSALDRLTGDWRVRFERDAETGVVNVLRVLPRGRAYRD